MTVTVTREVAVDGERWVQSMWDKYHDWQQKNKHRTDEALQKVWAKIAEVIQAFTEMGDEGAAKVTLWKDLRELAEESVRAGSSKSFRFNYI